RGGWCRTSARNQPPACVYYHGPERSAPCVGIITHISVDADTGLPVVGLIGDQLLVVLVQRHRHRPGAEGHTMAVEGAQRPSGDSLHERMGHIIGAQATVAEVDRGRVVEWGVSPRHSTPVQPEWRAIPVKVEGHDDAAS